MGAYPGDGRARWDGARRGRAGQGRVWLCAAHWAVSTGHLQGPQPLPKATSTQPGLCKNQPCTLREGHQPLNSCRGTCRPAKVWE